jgi:hypothetical protein
MEWIDVNDQLPNEDSSVLVVGLARYRTVADWSKESGWSVGREELFGSKDITHWMPLPELPKERHTDWNRELLLCDGVTVESRLPATPVEYTGKADHKEYYFKARGKRWRMLIGDTVDQCVEVLGSHDPLEQIDFYCVGRFSDTEFEAGYMPLEQAEEIIRRCVKLWRRGQEKKSD